jgi:hypothetical protein
MSYLHMGSARRLMFLRHAEKPDGVNAGVLADGSEDTHSLTAVGWERAGALAALFGYGTAPMNSVLSRPDEIYAAGASGSDGSQRPAETVSALAAKLGIAVIVKFPPDDFLAMLDEVVAHDGKSVLVSWEHKTLAAGLNAASALRSSTTNAASIPSAWPGRRFDMIWVFNRQAGGEYIFSQVPQLLLGGDLETPI